MCTDVSVVSANVDYLISRCGGYINEYGDVVDCDGTVLAFSAELAKAGLTPATVPHE